MTERVEEIRRQRDCFACRWTNGEHSQYCQVGILLTALAQAERERDEQAAKHADCCVDRQELAEARAEVERLKEVEAVLRPGATNYNRERIRADKAEADLARVRAVAEWAKNHRSRDCDCAALAEFARAALGGR